MIQSQNFHLSSFKVLGKVKTALILDQLLWLRGHLEENINDPGEDLEPLLNTVLVFARARTSTLQNVTSWKKVSRLAKKLNKAAKAVGAVHHRIELLRRGPKTYFVTCGRSPRFSWSLSLTHRDVGVNLDYFAPGHMRTNPPSPQCLVYFVEKTTFEEITGERVLIEYLKDDAIKTDFTRHNSRRETLFNFTMEKLALDYRFKCLVLWPDTLQSVPSVMALPDPPSAQWWDDHCFFVNFCIPGILLRTKFAFCGWKTNYALYWPWIQETFEFMMKYKRDEYWYASPETGTAFWNSMEAAFREIKLIGERNLDTNSNEFQEFLGRIRDQFGALAKTADNSSKAPSKRSVLPVHRVHATPLASRLSYKLLLVKETLSLHVLHRRRLTPKILRQVIGNPASGDEDAFQWFK